MKNLLTLIILVSSLTALGQGTWTRKADVIGEASKDAISFSIGNKIYFGTGRKE